MLSRFLRGYYKYVEVFKQGWNDVPHLYGTLAFLPVIFVGLVYRTAHTPPGGHIRRFKERYMIMRPNDERLIGYPKDYVTDNHLLK